MLVGSTGPPDVPPAVDAPAVVLELSEQPAATRVRVARTATLPRNRRAISSTFPGTLRCHDRRDVVRRSGAGPGPNGRTVRLPTVDCQPLTECGSRRSVLPGSPRQRG